ncbi:MAG TPA: hypothetical protein VGF10_03995 [Gaiella sp.]
MFSFVLFDPRDRDDADRRRPPRLADVRGDVRPVLPPCVRRG